jgi:hypothetical protein
MIPLGAPTAAARVVLAQGLTAAARVVLAQGPTSAARVVLAQGPSTCDDPPGRADAPPVDPPRSRADLPARAQHSYPCRYFGWVRSSRIFEDRKSVSLGGSAAPGARETLHQGGGLHPHLSKGYSGPPGPPRPPT